MCTGNGVQLQSWTGYNHILLRTLEPEPKKRLTSTRLVLGQKTYSDTDQFCKCSGNNSRVNFECVLTASERKQGQVKHEVNVMFVRHIV